MSERRRFWGRLGVAAALILVGAALHSWWLVGCGVTTVAIVLILRAWARRSPAGRSVAPVVAVLGGLGLGCLGLSAYLIVFLGGFGGLLLGAIGLLPATYFLVLACGVVYSATAGRRPPGADAVEGIFRALNSDLRIRHRRS